jgi:hypothetical protein
MKNQRVVLLDCVSTRSREGAKKISLFMVSGCAGRDVRYCYEKFIAGMARSYHKSRIFHGFRVAQRDVGYCYEKFIAGMARSYADVVSFHGFRVAQRAVGYCFENFHDTLTSWRFAPRSRRDRLPGYPGHPAFEIFTVSGRPEQR